MERWKAQDGIEIAYTQWAPERVGVPVVLHHGFIADANLNWVMPGVVAALVESGRRVIAPDARGHGQSDKPHDSSFYGEEKMARDLMGLLDHLGVTSYDLVGYSMGSVVSLLVAAQDARVRRLVVGGVGQGIIACGGVDTRALPNLALAAALEAADASGVTDPGAAGMRAFVDMVRADRKALAAHARVVHASPIALHAIKAPTLVMAGDADPLAVEPEALAAAIPGARLQRLTGDHLAALNDPRFIPELLAFLPS